MKKLETYASDFRKTSHLLNPKQSITQQLPITESKMGGVPHPGKLESWPTCESCQTPLNFVVQLYKDHFPTFPYLSGTDLFQLYRCPNGDCDEAGGELSDARLYWFFWKAEKSDQSLSKPERSAQEDKPKVLMPGLEDFPPEFLQFMAERQFEEDIVECSLQSEEVDDYPEIQEIWGLIDPARHDDLVRLREEMKEALEAGTYPASVEPKLNELETVMTAKKASKIGGYAAWQQTLQQPRCQCGQPMEFIFQLSSQEPHHSGDDGEWSDHGLMIGDLGNIYFFVCKACGPRSLVTRWDCG